MRQGKKTVRTKGRSGGAWFRWGGFRRWKSLEQQGTHYETYELSGWEMALALGKGAAVCALLAGTFYRSAAAFALMSPAILLAPSVERKKRKKKRQEQLAVQFKESMVVLASSLGAGFSVENALRVSLEELTILYGETGMITQEFRRMVQQIQMNRPVEQVLEDFARRSGIEEIRSFSEVFSVAKRSGGDLGAIMRHTAELLRDKMQVREEIRGMTASRQYEQRIMNVIPFFLVFYVECSSPGFFHSMYQTELGRVVMTGCLILYLAAFWMAGAILNIEV